jgi:Holliday junction resolvase
LKPERKFWLEVKKNTPEITWTRLENLALPGVPDLLGYNKHQHFFTVELKVTRSNKIRFSPHQISFHVQHPKNTFILVKSLVSRDWKLYEGKDVRQLATRGLALDACRSGLAACCLLLASLDA